MIVRGKIVAVTKLMVRLLSILSLAILAVAYSLDQGTAASTIDAFSAACNANDDTLACISICKRSLLNGADVDLPVVALNECHAVVARYAVRQAKSHLCDGGMCLHKLKPQKITKKGDDYIDRYAGDGYAVTLRYEWTDTGTWIYARISSRERRVSQFRTFCSGDGFCGTWNYRSGPIQKATIWIPSYHDLKKSIAIDIPR